MKAIFIAAGYGSRLKSETIDIPKPLVDINGHSILERQVSLFQKNGIDDIVIIVGPEKNKFNLKDVRYVHDVDFDKHEQLGSLMTAKSEINNDVIILFADILFDENILNQILESNADISIGLDLDWEKSYLERTDNPSSEADKILIKNNDIIKISKNIISHNADEKIGEFLGLLKLSNTGSKIFNEKYEKLLVSHSGKFHDAKSFCNAKLLDFLQELLESNEKLTPIPVKGKWCEIDTPLDLQRARKLFV
ncbi:NTP transferase domain-containing protein [Nitrosopumilus adriaticus]|uniref:phosphocholine cytidylyltransferase family protein n=1 Tax=Nitrosopumilus adriaticus TaxID=1580092 RepID=UPI00352E6E66